MVGLAGATGLAPRVPPRGDLSGTRTADFNTDAVAFGSQQVTQQ
jgi:hypothetical protein